MAMSVGQSEEYWKLRDEMLTPKYRLQNYGGTFAVAGFHLLLFTRNGRVRVRAPNTRAALIILIIAAPVLSVCAFVFDLFQGVARGEFPHWADTLVIPLMGVPVQFAVLMIWAIAHLGFLRGKYLPGVEIASAVSRRANWWLLFLSVITTVLVVLSAVDGAYWYFLAGTLWLYIYLSLAAIRRATDDTQSMIQADSPTSGESAI